MSYGDIPLHLSQLHRAPAARTALLQVSASPLNASAFAADCVVSPGEPGLAKVAVFVLPSR